MDMSILSGSKETRCCGCEEGGGEGGGVFYQLLRVAIGGFGRGFRCKIAQYIHKYLQLVQTLLTYHHVGRTWKRSWSDKKQKKPTPPPPPPSKKCKRHFKVFIFFSFFFSFPPAPCLVLSPDVPPAFNPALLYSHS